MQNLPRIHHPRSHVAVRHWADLLSKDWGIVRQILLLRRLLLSLPELPTEYDHPSCIVGYLFICCCICLLFICLLNICSTWALEYTCRFCRPNQEQDNILNRNYSKVQNKARLPVCAPKFDGINDLHHVLQENSKLSCQSKYVYEKLCWMCVSWSAGFQYQHARQKKWL